MVEENNKNFNWCEITSKALGEAQLLQGATFQLDLSGIDRIGYFELNTLLSLLDKTLLNCKFDITIEFILESDEILNKYIHGSDQYRNVERLNNAAKDPNSSEYKIVKAHKISGFLIGSYALKTLNNRHNPPEGGAKKFEFRLIDKDLLNYYNIYFGANNHDHSLIFPIKIIHDDESCHYFLSDVELQDWRIQLDDRFKNSAVLRSSEIWKIYCLELASNVWEHTDTIGFLTFRVLISMDKNGRLKQWIKDTYDYPILNALDQISENFLELCISDAGEGIASTLKDSYTKRTRSTDTEIVKTTDILQFAFDEQGSNKSDGESWVNHHALNQILRLIHKYGGVITVRSGKGEIHYISLGDSFTRIQGQLGYEAQSKFNSQLSGVNGTHIRLLVPLTPYLNQEPEYIKKRLNIATRGLPSLVRLNDEGPIGDIEPLQHYFDIKYASSSKMKDQFRYDYQKLESNIRKKLTEFETLVFDFTGLEWTVSQVMTLIYALNNVILKRPVILVGLDKDKVNQLCNQDISLDTTIDGAVIPEYGASGKALPINKNTILGNLTLDHRIVVVVDNTKYELRLLGLETTAHEAALLSVIDDGLIPIDQIENSPSFKEGDLKLILNNESHLFVINGEMVESVFTKLQLENAGHRAYSNNFKFMISESEAYIKNNKFLLPWNKSSKGIEWVDSFFECARIFSNERYVNEIAKRLIYRLECGIKILESTKHKYQLDEIEVLACVTSPSHTLALAIRYWWPSDRPPVIVDYGRALMMKKLSTQSYIEAKNIIIVQDIFNSGYMSELLIKLIGKNNIKAIISFARFQEGQELESDDIGVDAWEFDNNTPPKHAMVSLQKPGRAEPPNSLELEYAEWIEPKTLRTIKYKNLIGKNKTHKIYINKLNKFINGSQSEQYTQTEKHIKYGHYTYDDRHYTSVADIQNVIHSDSGHEIARWLADVCMGIISHVEKENDEDSDQDDKYSASNEFAEQNQSVTDILIPLHSHIYQLWPLIKDYLKDIHDRRVHVWFLDATLFIGSGPVYRLPLRFENKIASAIENEFNPGIDKTGKIIPNETFRLLLIDDAIISSRTLTTILESINQAVERKFKNMEKDKHKGKKLPESLTDIKTIKWIKFFSIFNYMPTSESKKWFRLVSYGSANIPFGFSTRLELRLPVYNIYNCPKCIDINRLTRLAKRSARRNQDKIKDWAIDQIEEIKPISVNNIYKSEPPSSCSSRNNNTNDQSTFLITLYKSTTGENSNLQLSQAHTAEYAIARFRDLMYSSFTISSILEALILNHSKNNSDTYENKQYALYRWVVLKWCMRNWHRLIVDGATQLFIDCIKNEVNLSTRV